MRLLYPAMAVAAGFFSFAAPASAGPATDFSAATELSSQLRIEEGRRGVRVDLGGPRRFERRRFERDCRVVVTRRVNRFGERVTERRRICD